MQNYKEILTLNDGSVVEVRNATPEDKPLIQEFVKSLSPESLKLRFLKDVSFEEAVERLLPAEGRGVLIALRNNRIVGHAAFEQIDEDKASIHLIIADDFQGKGMGTLLTGSIIEFARMNGINEIHASVSEGNYRMLRVLEKLGFPIKLETKAGIVTAIVPSSLLPEAIRHFEEKEAIAAREALKYFLQPRSVAVIGASRKRGGVSGEIFWNILSYQFNGPVYPVNARADVVQSVKAYKSVKDIPDDIDLAVITVPAKFVPQVAREAGEKGVKALVVISAGFAETGEEGRRLQEELVQICRHYGMRLIGPNCLGIVNTDPNVRLNAQFTPFVPMHGRIGFLSQSGALGVTIIDQSNKLGLGMSNFISVGNKADISANDLLLYWEEDPMTDIILLYLESFGNPRKFSRIAKRIVKKKPIIAVKSGRSAAGFRATQSHTGALVSTSDVTVNALFHQSGVIRTDTIEEMFEVAALLATQPVPKGERVGIITNAGGAGILAADASEAFGLKVPELSEKTVKRLREFLPPEAGFYNPVDMIASATPENYYKAIKVVAESGEVDSLIVIFIQPLLISPQDVAKNILKAVKELREEGNDITVLSVFMASAGISNLLQEGDIKIPSYPFPETAARALSKAVEYGKYLKRPEGRVPYFPDIHREDAAIIISRALSKGEEWLSPEDTWALLDAYGIPVARMKVVKDYDEAGEYAKELGVPVALKAIIEGVTHKTDVGGVKLNVKPEEVVETARKMLEELESKGYKVKGLIVQEMVPRGQEMLVGVTHDPIFGPIVVTGAGGIFVELMKDISVRITPITDLDAKEMITSLKMYPILKGYRGGPEYDVEKLEEIILRIGQMVDDLSPIMEMDLNPVIVFEKGKGAKVVDARVRVKENPTFVPPAKKRRKESGC